MKMKITLLSLVVIIIAICGIIAGKTFIGEKLFRNLSVSDISSVTAEVYSPTPINLAMNNDEIKELVEILNRVVVYRQDDSYTDYIGQAIVFNITKTDGTQIRINAYNPFIIIDGVGYKTKYEPCEELNRLGNNLESGKNG